MTFESEGAALNSQSKKSEFYLGLEIDPDYREYCRDFDRRLEPRYRRKAGEIERQLAPYIDLETAHLLDLGCRRGAYGRLLVGDRGRVTGLDLNLTELSLAVEEADRRMDYVFGNGYALPFPNESFDLVLCRHTLEHLSRPHEFLAEIHRVLRVGGICYLSTPNLFSATCFLSTGDGRRWLRSKWSGKDLGVHRLYSLPALIREAASAGFDRLKPLPFPGWRWLPRWIQVVRPSLKALLIKGS